MNDQVLETALDENTRRALERIRELWLETLPLLAVVESILQTPDEERNVGREFLPAASDQG